MEYTVIHNQMESRFEIRIEGQIALVDYVRTKNNCLNIMHTEVPPNLEGRGIAAALSKAILDYAITNGLKVNPICPYAKAYIQKHPEYQSILEEK